MLIEEYSRTFNEILYQAMSIAESAYDQVIRRWGNVKFAQSMVYDWVWSDEFCLLCLPLDEIQKGLIRLQILEIFRVKPWPWFPENRLEYPPLDR